MKCDILAIGAHPDDVELGCGATIAKHISLGKTVGIIDLTRGELGTRGTAATRDKEANAAAKLLGIKVRENLGFADGFFSNDKAHQLELIKLIRKYQPDIILANALYDRHPDHGRAGQLTAEACFLSGLLKIPTKLGGKNQKPWRPKAVYHYQQFLPAEPDFIVDVTGFMEEKLESVKAYKSQFFDPKSKEPETVISSEHFLRNVVERSSDLGRIIGVEYGEGFNSSRYIGTNNLFDLI